MFIHWNDCSTILSSDFGLFNQLDRLLNLASFHVKSGGGCLGANWACISTLARPGCWTREINLRHEAGLGERPCSEIESSWLGVLSTGAAGADACVISLGGRLFVTREAATD